MEDDLQKAEKLVEIQNLLSRRLVSQRAAALDEIEKHVVLSPKTPSQVWKNANEVAELNLSRRRELLARVCGTDENRQPQHIKKRVEVVVKPVGVMEKPPLHLLKSVAAHEEGRPSIAFLQKTKAVSAKRKLFESPVSAEPKWSAGNVPVPLFKRMGTSNKVENPPPPVQGAVVEMQPVEVHSEPISESQGSFTTVSDLDFSLDQEDEIPPTSTTFVEEVQIKDELGEEGPEAMYMSSSPERNSSALRLPGVPMRRSLSCTELVEALPPPSPPPESPLLPPSPQPAAATNVPRRISSTARRRAASPEVVQRVAQFVEPTPVPQLQYSESSFNLGRCPHSSFRAEPLPPLKVSNKKVMSDDASGAKQRRLVDNSIGDDTKGMTAMIRQLVQQVSSENYRIEEISKALQYISSRSQANFGVGSTPYIEHHKLLCQAVQRRNAALTVLTKLQSGESIRPGSDNKAPFSTSLHLSNLRLQLKPGYVMAPVGEVSHMKVPLHLVYLGQASEQHLLMLSFRVKDNPNVCFTEMVNIMPSNVLLESLAGCSGASLDGNYAELPNHFTFPNVAPDVELQVEVFLMSINADNVPLRTQLPVSAATLLVSPLGRTPLSPLSSHTPCAPPPSPSMSGTLSASRRTTSWMKRVFRTPGAHDKHQSKFAPIPTTRCATDVKKVKHSSVSGSKRSNIGQPLSPTQWLGVFRVGQFADHMAPQAEHPGSATVSSYSSSGSRCVGSTSSSRSGIKCAGFTSISSLSLTIDRFHASDFLLMRLPKLCPLTGILKTKILVNHKPEAALRGYINVYEDGGGIPNWWQTYCLAYEDELLMWFSRIDFEANKPPTKPCIMLHQFASTYPIEQAPRHICARNHTLLFYTVEEHVLEDGETWQDNLVQHRVGDWVVRKHLLSTDTAEEFTTWQNYLNSTLKFLMTWDASKYDKQRLVWEAATSEMGQF